MARISMKCNKEWCPQFQTSPNFQDFVILERHDRECLAFYCYDNSAFVTKVINADDGRASEGLVTIQPALNFSIPGHEFD